MPDGDASRAGAPAADVDDAQRELAARRRDLEREYDGKLRDLKAQVKRQTDALQQQRLEWEASRRAQQQELADKAERLRRQEESARKEAQKREAARQDLQQAKQQVVGGLDAARAEAEGLRADLEHARRHLGEAKGLLLGFVVLCLLAAVAWVATAWRGAGTAAMGLAALFLCAALVMNFWRSRIGR